MIFLQKGRYKLADSGTDIHAYLEAWEKGLITRGEFRSFIGLRTNEPDAVKMCAPNQGVTKLPPYGVTNAAFVGFETDDKRDEGY